MQTFFKIFVLSAIGLTTQACLFNGVSGSRNVTTENREINSDFNKLDVSQGIEVILTQGNSVTLSIEADDNLHEILMTEVKDSVLNIYFKENVSQRKASKVYLTIPQVSGINTSSGAEVNGQNTFNATFINFDASSGSEINMRLIAQEVSANSSSGSDITLMGTCQMLIANSSSGSEINAGQLIAQVVKADASSGADIDVNAVDKFTGNASSGASIDTEGNPKSRSVDKSSGGSVQVK
jgi:hypothetical protein